MPPINRYKCTNCRLAFPEGWGGYLYFVNDRGRRIELHHPAEGVELRRILGEFPDPELVEQRTGFNSYCVCLDCVAQFDLDLGDEIASPWRQFYAEHHTWQGLPRRKDVAFGTLIGRDERRCPKCESTSVKTCFEMIGKPCPRCGKGRIEEIVTGTWT